jgi:hypothetical protein
MHWQAARDEDNRGVCRLCRGRAFRLGCSTSALGVLNRGEDQCNERTTYPACSTSYQSWNARTSNCLQTLSNDLYKSARNPRRTALDVGVFTAVNRARLAGRVS